MTIFFISYDHFLRTGRVTVSTQEFAFDDVFGMDFSEEQLYERTAGPMLRSFTNGFNCTILAYGQTGSGKTHTMGTGEIAESGEERQGLVRTFVQDLFKQLSQYDFQVKVTYLEIYGEKVKDLLASEGSTRSDCSKESLTLREDKGRVYVEGLQEHIKRDAAAIFELLRLGSKNRATAATKANASSSRSHAVFTLHLEQKIQDNKLSSTFTFVDLAGSERVSQTSADGQLQSETININKGLSALGRVINSIAKKDSHVPYRDSKLTRLLQDALGGNSQTLFLACVSPAAANIEATCSTLQVLQFV